jgi:hypothetical protein
LPDEIEAVLAQDFDYIIGAANWKAVAQGRATSRSLALSES